MVSSKIALEHKGRKGRKKKKKKKSGRGRKALLNGKWASQYSLHPKSVSAVNRLTLVTPLKNFP